MGQVVVRPGMGTMAYCHLLAPADTCACGICCYTIGGAFLPTRVQHPGIYIYLRLATSGIPGFTRYVTVLLAGLCPASLFACVELLYEDYLLDGRSQ
jgi:hypothetical protein